MKTIKEKIESKLIINKSEFITIINKVNNVSEVPLLLNEIKKEYKDANHYCFAYIIDNVRKSSDDGEPGGTAGIPIEEVLLKNDLNNVLAVVVRYFGGIKLGAGGLTRAYTKSVSDCIKENKNKIVSLIDGYEIIINARYEDQKEIDYLLKNTYYTKKYNESVTYLIKCDSKIKEILESKYDIITINNIKIESE